MHVTLSIIGLDRISTSFALALKRYQSQPKAQHTFTITGSDSSPQAMKAAEKMSAIDKSDRKPSKAVANAELVIVRCPPGSLAEIYGQFGPALKPGAVVLDLSDLKEPSIALARQHFPANERGASLAFIVGVTPIVNVSGLYTGGTGPEAASADLLDEAECLVLPDTQCPSEAIRLAEDMIRLAGGVPRFMDPAEHDALTAATEQLPALLGAALFYALQQSEGWPDLRRMVNPTLALAFQSLRTQTPNDLHATFTHNRANLARHLDGVPGVLSELRAALASDDSDKLAAFLALVGQEWEKWDGKRYSGKWDEGPQIEKLPGALAAMGGFLTMPRKRKEEDDD
ncbi:MAG: prephenate dehydrogenase/arogenate dehydrogenase family protein [Anaerolineae bacterium]|nr:prephenate dehydrogenase/arogenate dehydrogenase family protein [Anaerolineae bacterium]